MHRWILGAGALLAVQAVMAQTAAASTCTRPQQVMERFIDADCEACWSSPAQAPAPNGAWVMDWIVPGASGSEAPLALAALDEARARRDAVQALKPLPASGEADWRLPARPPLRLAVAGGPAWNGYLGLQLQVRGSAPAGARAYLALVEDVPADAEGNASARRLVRAVAGPIALGDAPASELRALRIPEGAKPERLLGMAWWVDRDERLLGITAEGCPREK